MTLDRRTCRRARLARDPRFDGQFFIGVKTTGIFCRPICPAVPPKESNVDYFPSAAAAAQAGFRACLRCRPECSPGTPAWSGTSTTVARALRLIGDGALEDEGVEKLAERLGIGDRQLRRLFMTHLGAAPIAVAQMRRLLAAKQLIDQTDLPLTTVALSAGYGSLRRFNAAFVAGYGRAPRDLRKSALTRGGRQRSAPTGVQDRNANARYGFRLRYRPPFDWDGLLQFIRPRAIPGIELVEANAYKRTIALAGRVGWLQVAPSPDGKPELTLTIDFPDPTQSLRIVSGVRRMFDLDADPVAIDTHLASDPLLAPLVRSHPGLRLPGGWDGFELGVRAILGQQITVAGATTLAGRLVSSVGHPLPVAVGRLTHTFPTAQEVAGADLSGIGLPRKRAETIRAFAGAVAHDALRFDGSMDPEQFRSRLFDIAGIGPWTAQYISLRCLGDPDAFPSGDLGLMRALALGSSREVEERAACWQPWRAYAALHLWTSAMKKENSR